MPDPKNQPPLLELRGFKRHFPVDDGFFFGSSRTVKAVDGVDLTITKGESLGLVGESGCGKSTVGRNIVRLDTPTAGEIRFDGVDIAGFDTNQLKPYRQQIQIIFQNPFSSLNPRKTAGNMLSEPLLLHKIGDRKERRDRVIELLSHVGLGSEHYDRYPHEFSGGQRQRLGIARALALQPKLVVCDEPVSALDVSIQSQILNLLCRLQEEFGLSYLFISHNLSVVEHMCDRVAVMYLGRIVETASAADLYAKAYHPYTRALLSAIPTPDPTAKTDEIILEGSVPSPVDPPAGCHFSTRCPFVKPECSGSTPSLREFEPGHFVRCHRLEEIL